MKTALISVDYDEFDQASYRSVCAKISDEDGDLETKTFASDDFTADMHQLLEWIRKQDVGITLMTSSVDSFLMDGPIHGWQEVE